MQRALNAQPANGSVQMTVPIKSCHIEVEKRRDTPDLFNMPTKRGNAMSVNPTKTTPAPVAGGHGGRGRSKELPILDHAAVVLYHLFTIYQYVNSYLLCLSTTANVA